MYKEQYGEYAYWFLGCKGLKHLQYTEMLRDEGSQVQAKNFSRFSFFRTCMVYNAFKINFSIQIVSKYLSLFVFCGCRCNKVSRNE